MGEAIVQAEDLHKTYRVLRHPVPVLLGASLSVATGETVAVIGRSGAGKSTLLYVLGALHHPDRGTVRFDGEDLYGMSERRRARVRASQVGFVFQSYHLFPEMDVLENVMLPAMAAGGLMHSRARIRARAMELLDAVGLTARATHTPMELSGGEQQRAALARALVNDPRLVLADEPTGNLDDGTGGQVLDYLFSLVRGQSRTLVMVTHNLAIARRCDRILRLENGRLEAGQSGTGNQQSGTFSIRDVLGNHFVDKWF